MVVLLSRLLVLPSSCRRATAARLRRRPRRELAKGCVSNPSCCAASRSSLRRLPWEPTRLASTRRRGCRPVQAPASGPLRPRVSRPDMPPTPIASLESCQGALVEAQSSHSLRTESRSRSNRQESRQVLAILGALEVRRSLEGPVLQPDPLGPAVPRGRQDPQGRLDRMRPQGRPLLAAQAHLRHQSTRRGPPVRRDQQARQDPVIRSGRSVQQVPGDPQVLRDLPGRSHLQDRRDRPGLAAQPAPVVLPALSPQTTRRRNRPKSWRRESLHVRSRCCRAPP
jgi:hypothetical protein